MKNEMQELFNIKMEIALLKQEQLKPLEEKARELEKLLLEKLEENGTDQCAINGLGTISRKEAIVPNAKDWNAIHSFIQETGSFHLLNKALNAAAYRETVEMGEQVPGIEPFTRVSLSVRKKSA